MRVILIPGLNPGPYTGAGNNTYLIPGREPTLIDGSTGSPEYLEALSDALSGSRLTQVVVTHGHSDHASGAAQLAARWPAARFFKMPWPERDSQYAVKWTMVASDDRITAGDSTLRIIATPGHAPDHVCLYEENSGTLFCGDLVIQGQTVVIPASVGGSLTNYLESLTLIRNLVPNCVLPAHGPEITDLPRLVDEYVAHRLEREVQIVSQLNQGPMSRDMLVARIYSSLSGDLRSAASDSVLAHLIKLRDEGCVLEQGGRWVLIAPGH